MYRTPGLKSGMPVAPVVDFISFFNLKTGDEVKISFTAVLNCSGMAGIQKLDAKVEIGSEYLPMDTIYIEAEQAEIAGLPAVLQAWENIFSYLPGQFLMIKGYEEQYGHYNILIHPKMIKVAMD
ncbi:MAG: hypothetical protein QM791_07570 [Ferruginibacter sp.]